MKIRFRDMGVLHHMFHWDSSCVNCIAMAYMCGRIVLGARAVHSSTSSLGTLHIGLQLRHRFDKIVGGQNFLLKNGPKKIILPRTFWNALFNRAKRKLSFGLRIFVKPMPQLKTNVPPPIFFSPSRCGTVHCSVVWNQSDYGWHWVRQGKKSKSDFQMKNWKVVLLLPWNQTNWYCRHFLFKGK